MVGRSLDCERQTHRVCLAQVRFTLTQITSAQTTSLLSYRLASLGFLAGKALESEGSLNLGVRDQRLALHWVQENIGAFGGDVSWVFSLRLKTC